MNRINESQAKVALLELLYRNDLRNDSDAYEMLLALYGLGLLKKPPSPYDFSQEVINPDDAAAYAISQGANYQAYQDEEAGREARG